MVALFSNNATGTLAASYNAAATSLTLTSGQGALFPSPSGGDFFMATVVNNANAIEIVRVTARSGDTFTVQRGQEGTSARALAIGEKFELRITAGALASIRDKVQQTADIANGAVTTSKLADLAVTAAKLAAGAIDGAAKIADGVITGAKLQVGAVIANLGFTPVQQGGGTGQTQNKIYLGWSEPKLRAQVDASDLGFLLTEKDDGGAGGAGYRGLPQNVQNTNYQLGLGDAGRHILHTSGSHQYTVPADAVPFAAGTVIQFVNDGGAITVTPAAGVTLVWAPTGATGARNVAANGVATLEKISANRWYIYGAGLS